VKREPGRWIVVIGWLIVIFALPNILSLSGEGPRLPKRFDKVIHFFEYVVLAILISWSLNKPLQRERFPVFCAAVFAGLAIGALDEFTQYFLPLRDSSIRDWLADAAGILAGASLAIARRGRAANKREAI
jgi:VanZ family protein